MALLTGYHLCGVGVAGLIFVASARIWGKRHLYLLGTILIIVSSAWGGAAGKNYASLLWARVGEQSYLDLDDLACTYLDKSSGHWPGAF